MADEKGICCVCGKRAPDSVVCDDCFLKNVVKPTMAAISRGGTVKKSRKEHSQNG